MKLAVIGGGGVRSMFLAKSIAGRAEKMGITELVFMDNNEQKLNIYGKMAREVSRRLCPFMDFVLTTDPIKAIKDADYVITTIRAGGDRMRCRDERIALNMGILGQETTGAAGFSFAMRSIPALKEYCELVKKYAKPDALVFNFTNPAGVVSQTLRDMGYDFTYGICDAPSGMLRRFEELYGYPENHLDALCYGLNHLSFFEYIKADGIDITSKIVSDDEAYKNTDLRYFDKKFLMRKQYVPNEYMYYFYNREKAVENILNAERTRGEQIAEINEKMTEELSAVDIENNFEKALEIFEYYYGLRENSYMASETGNRRESKWHFDMYAPDDGGYAGVALGIIDAKTQKSDKKIIACVPNTNKAISFLDEADTVEISCEIVDGKVTPIKIGNVPFENQEIITRVKAYERLASKAIINCDRESAVDCLYLHPLVSSYSLAEKLVDQYIELNKDFTGEWK